MAKLHFHYGVMSSSKSAKLIIHAYNFQQTGNTVEVLKPAYDTRFSNTTVKSRIGIETPALALQNLAIPQSRKPKSYWLTKCNSFRHQI